MITMVNTSTKIKVKWCAKLCLFMNVLKPTLLANNNTISEKLDSVSVMLQIVLDGIVIRW